jgi:hypothetical protein
MTTEQARELFEYRDGDLYWRKVVRGVQRGSPVGCSSPKGYRRVIRMGKSYAVHNLVWNYHHGEVPVGFTIDHIDRDPSNNRLDNLRPATQSEQHLNRGPSTVTRPSLSGHRNIRHTSSGKWKVRMSRGGVDMSRGVYDTLEEAISVRDGLLSEHHPVGTHDVFWDVKHSTWDVRLYVDGKRHYVGWFDHIEDAVAARDAFKATLSDNFKHFKS